MFLLKYSRFERFGNLNLQRCSQENVVFKIKTFKDKFKIVNEWEE
jgi:hypothetical protein